MKCGYCGSATSDGAMCGRCVERLKGLISQCRGLDGDLRAAAGKQLRFGSSEVRGSAGPGLPVNFAAVDVRRSLESVLTGAAREVAGRHGEEFLPDWPGVVGYLLRSLHLLCACSAGPVLLGELVGLVPCAVRIVDRPAPSLRVRVACPVCGEGPLRLVGGLFECAVCRCRVSLEVLRAACGC